MRHCSLLLPVLCLVVPAACDNRPGAEPKAAPSTGAPAAKAPAPAPADPAAKTEASAKPSAGAGAAGAGAAAAVQPATASGQMIRTPSGLAYEVLREGEGPSPPLGSRITVHFAGYVDGRKFRDTREGGVPKEFELDKGRLIEGWVEALLTMKKGELRKLAVPSQLAYGRSGYPGVVPPEKDLTFELELVSFVPPGGP